LTNCIYHDIVYVVSRLNKYTQNPGVKHWDAINMLLR